LSSKLALQQRYLLVSSYLLCFHHDPFAFFMFPFLRALHVERQQFLCTLLVKRQRISMLTFTFLPLQDQATYNVCVLTLGFLFIPSWKGCKKSAEFYFLKHDFPRVTKISNWSIKKPLFQKKSRWMWKKDFRQFEYR
jgi:hypothetical protein